MMAVLFYKFDKIGNSTQSPAQPQSGQFAELLVIMKTRKDNLALGSDRSRICSVKLVTVIWILRLKRFDMKKPDLKFSVSPYSM